MTHTYLTQNFCEDIRGFDWTNDKKIRERVSRWTGTEFTQWELDTLRKGNYNVNRYRNACRDNKVKNHKRLHPFYAFISAEVVFALIITYVLTK